MQYIDKNFNITTDTKTKLFNMRNMCKIFNFNVKCNMLGTDLKNTSNIDFSPTY